MAKVRITKAPSSSTQRVRVSGLPNQATPSWNPAEMSTPDMTVARTLKPVPRDQANIEAEKGETVLFPNKGGLPAHFNIGGNRHSNGGTPLNVTKDSFVYSDTKKMRIKDPEILAEFGKSKGSYTPAELAKKYDINKFRKILQDPDSDPIMISTAEKMISNYNLKLAKLALVQESKKGFPQGIPEAAMPYMATFNVTPDQILPLRQPTEDTTYEEIPQAKWGGFLPKAQTGLENQDPEALRKFYEDAMRKRRLKEQAEEFALKKARAEFYAKQQAAKLASQKATSKKKVDSAYETLEQLSGKKYLPLGSTKRAIGFDNAYDQYVDAVGQYSGLFPVPPPPPMDYSGKNPNVPYQNIPKLAMPAPVAAWPKIPANVPPVAPVVDDGVEVELTEEEMQALGVIKFGGYYEPGGGVKTTKKKLNAAQLAKLQEMRAKAGKPAPVSTGTTPKGAKKAAPVEGYGITVHLGDTQESVDPTTGKKSKSWNAARIAKSNKELNDLASSLGFKPDNFEGKDVNEKFQNFLLTIPEFKTEIEKAHSTDQYGMPVGPKGGKMVDSYLGTRWIDAIAKAQKAKKPVEVPEVKTPTPVTEPGPKVGPPAQFRQADQNAPFWIQDVINTASAAGTRLGLKKYLPWAPPVHLETPRPTFYDPTRELAANAEQMDIGTQGAGLFAGPQAYNARFAQIQGAGAKNAANILSNYHNKNVGVANQFENIRTGIMNKEAMMNAASAQKLYDQTTVANQQFDNAKRQANNQLRESYINAITNRAQTQTLNELYPHYQVDPMSGGFTEFDEASVMIPGRGNKTLAEQMAEVNAARPIGWTPREMIDYLGRGSKQDRREDNLYEYDDNPYSQHADYLRQRNAVVPMTGNYGYEG